MLLMTRRTGEAIVINGDIIIKVLEVRGGRVKLGCEYPTGSSVFRQELFDKIREENEAAAKGSAKAPQAIPAGLARLLQDVGKTNNPNKEHTDAATSPRKPGQKQTKPEEY